MSLQRITQLLQRLAVSAPSPRHILSTWSSAVPSKCLMSHGGIRPQVQQLLTPQRTPNPVSSVGICRNFHQSLQMSAYLEQWRIKEYTVIPIKMRRDGGRDPLTGRKMYKRRGGGHRRRFRMIDWHRVGPSEGPPFKEKVLSILYDPNRSARIAMVAGGAKKRYILATINMKEGDIIKTSAKIGRMTVVASEGDAYPVGAYPIGALVHNLEKYPGAGGTLVHSAGTSAQILRKAGGQVVLQLPSKRLISISETCMATYGRLSNEDHNQRILGKAGRSRWLGIRPKSGWKQKKGGWAGRKIKPLPPMKVYLDPKAKGTRIEGV